MYCEVISHNYQIHKHMAWYVFAVNVKKCHAVLSSVSRIYQIFLLLAPCCVITRRPITYRLPGMAWNFK